ncbi:4-hydroxybenzoate octaprenyltransferase [Thiococcus pfennigii]|uniref:4-hydroxybenzoate octaprenyltransferase n=1 Tax=Thiococcus pfennigii TaxID=1057 RepID=UPI0019063243|nr:4-hydroxybenzoate octaprenyltransferase [Thiococcus pfennigii]MBK1701104.1 4-hydroxybenzoate polyprenyltransferase [Thiococcus pfennigii]MBK1733485.1 4-hydroxybenzoate polyprenyltransferase [Thiococcus pfennigii]
MTLSDTNIARSPASSWRERLSAYARLTRINRPIGIFLLMWPALWALWLAGAGQPPWGVVVIFLGGGVLMRSAGCAINDFADRDFDAHVARTRARPLAVGDVTPREALAVFVVLSLLAFGLVLMLNWQTIAMSVVALLLAAIYPFMKRFTHMPQLFLGAAFGWAIPMAFTAITGSVPGFAWLLFATALIWALIYDTQYAMVDREDDLKIGVKSTAILFGRHDLAVIAVLQVAMLLLLVVIGVWAGLGAAYFGGVAVAGGLFAYQQYLTRRREPAACFKAFLNNNYFGMAIFIGLVLDYALTV